MADQEQQNQKISNLIRGIKEGDATSSKEMLRMFTPLIRKTCAIIFARYNGLVSMEELLNNGNQLLIYLAGVEYKPDGKAHFPYFIKTHLHARLVQMFRPMVAYRKRAVPLEDYIQDERSMANIMHRADIQELMPRINDFMWKKFNEKELDIVISHMINGISRDQLALKYGVSNMRMKTIHKRCITKLRKFLATFGIKTREDI